MKRFRTQNGPWCLPLRTYSVMKFISKSLTNCISNQKHAKITCIRTKLTIVVCFSDSVDISFCFHAASLFSFSIFIFSERIFKQTCLKWTNSSFTKSFVACRNLNLIYDPPVRFQVFLLALQFLGYDEANYFDLRIFSLIARPRKVIGIIQENHNTSAFSAMMSFCLSKSFCSKSLDNS